MRERLNTRITVLVASEVDVCWRRI